MWFNDYIKCELYVLTQGIKVGKFIDLTNLQFNKLTIVKKSEERTATNKILWECKCSCGNPKTVFVNTQDLKSGHTTSCGECKRFEIIGKQFNNVLVLNYYGMKYGHSHYLCKCLKCNNEFIVRSGAISHIKDCGCSCGKPSKNSIVNFGPPDVDSIPKINNRNSNCSIKKLRDPNAKPPATDYPEYTLWNNIRHRCYLQSHRSQQHYSSRGIGMCPEWKESFETFYNYLIENIGPKPIPNHSLDRIDNNRGYEPGNIRWATTFEQAINKSTTKFTIEDVKKIREDFLSWSGTKKDFYRKIAKQYNSGLSTVQQIINNITWKNI